MCFDEQFQWVSRRLRSASKLGRRRLLASGIGIVAMDMCPSLTWSYNIAGILAAGSCVLVLLSFYASNLRLKEDGVCRCCPEQFTSCTRSRRHPTIRNLNSAREWGRTRSSSYIQVAMSPRPTRLPPSVLTASTSVTVIDCKSCLPHFCQCVHQIRVMMSVTLATLTLSVGVVTILLTRS